MGAAAGASRDRRVIGNIGAARVAVVGDVLLDVKVHVPVADNFACSVFPTRRIALVHNQMSSGLGASYRRRTEENVEWDPSSGHAGKKPSSGLRHRRRSDDPVFGATLPRRAVRSMWPTHRMWPPIHLARWCDLGARQALEQGGGRGARKAFRNHLLYYFSGRLVWVPFIQIPR